MTQGQTPTTTLPDELQRRKNAADVAKVEADARQAEANARKTQIEADKAAAAALREQISALVPDLTKVEESTLEVKDGTPMWGTFLTFSALPWVADRIATILVEKSGGDLGKWRFLVTSDPDLASADAAYGDVTSGLDQLIQMCDELLGEAQVKLDPVTGGLALAAALPGLLSLLSARRTVSTAARAANDLAAVAAVTRQLRNKAPDLVLVYDDFRLVPDGTTVHQRVADVGDRRVRLVARKLTLSDEKSKTDAELVEAKAATPPDATKIAELTRLSTDAATRLGLIDSAILAIDTVLAGIRTVPAGAKRSLLATTALHEALHAQTEGFTHVLLVKGEAGQAREELDNRPLWLNDKFFAIADASITFILIETGSSNIVTSGTVTRLASASGDTNDAPVVQVGAAATA